MTAGSRTTPVVRQRHPWAAVDVVVFTIRAGRLRVLLIQLKGGPLRGRWALPGGRVGLEESLDAAARREVSEKTGARQPYLEQLHTFGAPTRDPISRVVSTAYLSLIPDRGNPLYTGPKYRAIGWFSGRRLPPLAYDHRDVISSALRRLRAKVGYSNVIARLLPRQFALSELQHAYEAILGRSLDRRNFRRKILASGLLRPLERHRRGRHRPATLYRFRHRQLIILRLL